MGFKRSILIAAVLAAQTTHPLMGQDGVTITSNTNQVQAKVGEKAAINLVVDIPAIAGGYRAGPDPYCTVGATEGKMTPLNTTGGNWGNNNVVLYLPRVGDADHVHAAASIVWETPANPRAGQVLITAECGTHVLGGATQGMYRGQTTITLIAVPGGGIGGPVTESPFTPTGDTVDPPGEVLKRLVPLAGLLAALGGASYAGSRKPQAPKAPEKDPPGPEKGAAVAPPERPKEKKPPDPKEPEDPEEPEDPKKPEKKKKDGSFKITAERKPTDPIVVSDGTSAARTYDYRGNFSEDVQVAVAVTPSEGWSASFSQFVLPKMTPGGGYDQWQLDDDCGWHSGDVGLGDVMYLRLRIPWEWKDKILALSLPFFKVDLDETAGDGHKQLPAHASVDSIRIMGANPKIVMEPEPPEMDATGWDSTKLNPHLWLFGNPAEGEQLAISKTTSIIGGNAFDAQDNGAQIISAVKQIKAGADITVLSQQLGIPESVLNTWRSEYFDVPDGTDPNLWTAPFLIQDLQQLKDYVDIASVRAECKWTGGTQWQFAPDDHRNDAITSEACDVQLRGCTAELVDSNAVSRFFCPGPKTQLFGAAALFTSDHTAVPNPFAAKAARHSQAKIHCEVRDLSQGPPSQNNGCKLPPEPQFNTSLLDSSKPITADQAKAIVDAAPLVATVEKILVDNNGRLYTADGMMQSQFPNTVQPQSQPFVLAGGVKGQTADSGPVISLWNYTPKEGCDPIHGQPVVYTIIIEDGFNGILRVPGTCIVKLASLVFETGGADFRIYESQAHSLDVQYDPGDFGYRPPPGDATAYSLSCQFAVVDAAGNPLCSANPQEPVTRAVYFNNSDGFHLIFGHMPEERAIVIGKADQGQRPVRLMPRDEYYQERFPSPDWIKVEGPDRQFSEQIRTPWHALKGYAQEEKALKYLPAPGACDPGTSSEASEPGFIWMDQVLPLSVRLELRNPEGGLIATSDRLIRDSKGTEIRTPPDAVWRDHRFGYVLAALRLVLRDESDKPYEDRPYRLTMGKTVSEGRTEPQGVLKQIIPPGVDKAMLELLSDDSDTEPYCRWNLQLGYLDPIDEHPANPGAPDKGIQERLNNVGLFASPDYDHSDTDQFERAVRRFQALHKLEMSGQVDEKTKNMLEMFYATGSE